MRKGHTSDPKTKRNRLLTNSNLQATKSVFFGGASMLRFQDKEIMK